MKSKLREKSGVARVFLSGVVGVFCCFTFLANAWGGPGIILVIGDGMGPQQVGLLQLYHTYLAASDDAIHPLQDFWQKSTLSMVQPFAQDTLVIDSAAAASQLATGQPSLSESLGLDAHGIPVATIVEKARDRGWRTGLVSDTRLTHATPAGFVAHVGHRSEEDTIALQMLESGIDVMLSGGWNMFLGPDPTTEWRARIQASGGFGGGQRGDGRNLLQEASKKGYAVVLNRDELFATGENVKVLGLFAASGMADTLARGRGERTYEPTLAEMTRRAIQLLDRDDTPFFLMVEAGQIDWAAHANDAGYMLGELLSLQDAMVEVLQFAQQSPASKVILTADHETGGFGFSYQMHGAPAGRVVQSPVFKERLYQPGYNFGATSTLTGLRRQSRTLREIVQEFEQLPARVQSPSALVQLVQKYTGYEISSKEAHRVLQVTDNRYFDSAHRGWGGPQVPDMGDDHSFYPYVSTMRSALLGRVLSLQQGVVWSTGTHTSTPVPFWSYGGSQPGMQGIRSQPEAGTWLGSQLDQLSTGKK